MSDSRENMYIPTPHREKNFEALEVLKKMPDAERLMSANHLRILFSLRKIEEGLSELIAAEQSKKYEAEIEFMEQEAAAKTPKLPIAATAVKAAHDFKLISNNEAMQQVPNAEDAGSTDAAKILEIQGVIDNIHNPEKDAGHDR